MGAPRGLQARLGRLTRRIGHDAGFAALTSAALATVAGAGAAVATAAFEAPAGPFVAAALLGVGCCAGPLWARRGRVAAFARPDVDRKPVAAETVTEAAADQDWTAVAWRPDGALPGSNPGEETACGGAHPSAAKAATGPFVEY